MEIKRRTKHHKKKNQKLEENKSFKGQKVLEQSGTNIENEFTHNTMYKGYYSEQGLQKEEYILFSTCFVAVMTLYTCTLYPSIPGGDSGELVSAAKELGIAHPPGYPLFTMMAKCFQLVLSPVGNPAWSTGVMSAVCGSLCCSLLCVILFKLTQLKISSLFASLSFSLSRLAWEWSITPEVFSLNNLFVTLVMLATLDFSSALDKKRKTLDATPLKKAAFLGCFICGLSLSNQHTIVLFIACIAVWVLKEIYDEKMLSLELSFKMALCVGLGLLPYLYLPLAKLFRTKSLQVTWGDQSSLRGFLKHILRVDYGTFKLGRSYLGESDPLLYMQKMAQHSYNELTFVVLIFSLLGFFWGSRIVSDKFKRSFLVWRVMLLLYTAFFAWRSNLDLKKDLLLGVTERFWLQSNLLICSFAGIGLGLFVKDTAIDKYVEKSSLLRNYLNRHNVASIITLLVIFFQLQRNIPKCDRSKNTVVRDFGLHLMKTFPNNSLVMVKGDITYTTLFYLHVCENIRPDLRLIHESGMSFHWYHTEVAEPYLSHRGVVFPGNKHAKVALKGSSPIYYKGFNYYDIGMFLDANEGKPIFICLRNFTSTDLSWKRKYTLMPWGGCNKVISRNQTLNVPSFRAENKKMISWDHPYRLPPSHDLSEDMNFPPTSWEQVVNDEMWFIKGAFGKFMLSLTTQIKSKNDLAWLYNAAYEEFHNLIEEEKRKTSLRISTPILSVPPLPISWHKHLGQASLQLLASKGNMLYEHMEAAWTHFSVYLHLLNEYEEKDNDVEAIKRTIIRLRSDLNKNKRSTSTKNIVV